jgi:uncharacterized protein YcgL (UPF0745 family)
LKISRSIFEKDWISTDNPNGVDPSEFVDLAWDESERRIVISYLKSFECTICASSINWCPFRCKQKWISGYYIFDDGFFSWSNICTHVVEYHYVKPDVEFILHVLSRKHLINTQVLNEYNEVKECAKEQKYFLTSGFDGELWLIPSEFKVNPAVLKFFRQFDGLYDLSTKSLIDYIKTSKKVLLEKKYDYADYIEIDITAKELGIILEFIEKDS